MFEIRSKHRPGDPRVLRRARLPRSRDADDAADSRRRRGQALQDAPQRARHGPVPAHRAGALSQAPGGGRPREGVRDQPQLPERRHLDAPQSRVHDARVLRGLPGLPLPDGPHRGAAARGRARRCSARRSSPTRARPSISGKTFDRLTMAEAIAKYNPQYHGASSRRPAYLQGALAPFDVEVFPTDGVGLAAAEALRGDDRGEARRADLHHRASRGRLAARARATTPIPRSPTASSSSSRAARSPTASRS